MATIFPDPYMHIGGDETPAPTGRRTPHRGLHAARTSLKDNAALQAYFNTRVLKILTDLNKHMVGWDEILNPALPKDVVIQSWRGASRWSDGAKQGYQGILSAPYYLDGMKPARQHYLADPLPRAPTLTPEQRKLILGGEVCMWGEHLDARTIDSRIWPRTAAIAERFWSPENVHDVDDMYRRLNVVFDPAEGAGPHSTSSQEDAACVSSPERRTSISCASSLPCSSRQLRRAVPAAADLATHRPRPFRRCCSSRSAVALRDRAAHRKLPQGPHRATRRRDALEPMV